MELSEVQFFEKHNIQSMHCIRNTIPTYEYQWTCISCGNSVIKRKNELLKIQ